MVGLTSMYDPSSLSKYSRSRYSVAYAGNESELLTSLQASPDFRVYQMDLSTAVAALGERKLAAVVYVPDTQPDDQDPVKITLYTLQNDLQTAIVEVKLRDIFLKYEEDLREIRSDRLKQELIPLKIPEPAGGGDFYEFVYGLLIPLLVFMPAIIASALVIDLITEEYQHETLETLISTPVTIGEMSMGKSDCLRGAGAHPGRCVADPPHDQRYRDPEFRIDPAPGHRDLAHSHPARSTYRTPLPRTYCCTVHLFHSAGSRNPVCPCFAIKSS